MQYVLFVSVIDLDVLHIHGLFISNLLLDCPSLNFQCANGLCLNYNERCDGVNDCGDGSDELQCSMLHLCISLCWMHILHFSSIGDIYYLTFSCIEA